MDGIGIECASWPPPPKGGDIPFASVVCHKYLVHSVTFELLQGFVSYNFARMFTELKSKICGSKVKVILIPNAIIGYNLYGYEYTVVGPLSCSLNRRFYKKINLWKGNCIGRQIYGVRPTWVAVCIKLIIYSVTSDFFRMAYALLLLGMVSD